MKVEERKGKIITFYSYKGGTGRSMALANVAWILASQGNRVLTIDWDLEAPGLHRYFHPFLVDKELTCSDGIIDFVYKFTTAASLPNSSKKNKNNSSETKTSKSDDKKKTKKPIDEEWYKPYTNILRYAASLDWKFKDQGTIDFIPAGRHGSSYATRINSFDWRFFYEELGGGHLLELAKERMRAEYDFILIDSRTGVSDTSGICTIQMPDILVVCFTLNNQSIEGAAAVAQDVFEKRFKQSAVEPAVLLENSSEPKGSIQIFPVPMRVENAEKKKLQAREDYAREKFKLFPNAFSDTEREKYWGNVPFIYVPYYAYEEILAAFGDKASDRISILAASEQVTTYITNGEVVQLEPPPEAERKRILELFEGKTMEVDSAAEENRFAETIFNGLSPNEQRQMRQLMLRLVRISGYSEVSGDVPLRTNVEEIESSAAAIINLAIDAGLVRKETDETYGGEYIKVAQDSLINNWIRLREWIKEDQEFLLWRQKLQIKLSEWNEVNKHPSALLKGVLLEEAQRWVETRIGDLNDSELHYIDWSTVESERFYTKIRESEELGTLLTKEKEEKESIQSEKVMLEEAINLSKRRFYTLSLFIGIISVVVTITTIYISNKQPTKGLTNNVPGEKSLELVRLSQGVNNSELSLLLAIQAVRLEANEKSEATLKEYLGKWRQQYVLPHDGVVYTAVYNADSDLIATASDKKVLIWKQQDSSWSSAEIDTKQEQTKAISFMPNTPYNANPSSELFITAGVDGNINLSSASEKSYIKTLKDIGVEITSASYSPDGRRILVSTTSNKVIIYDQSTIKELGAKQFKGDINSACFSPDGKFIVAGGKSGEAMIYDADLIKEVASRKKHRNEIQSVAFSPDSKFIVTATSDGTATIWSIDGNEPVITITNNLIPIKDAEFSPDGGLIVTAAVDGKARVYDVSNGKLLFDLETGHMGPVNSAKFIRNGANILTAGDKTARIWNAAPEINVSGSIDELISQSCAKVTRNLTQEEWKIYMQNEPYQKTCENLP